MNCRCGEPGNMFSEEKLLRNFPGHFPKFLPNISGSKEMFLVLKFIKFLEGYLKNHDFDLINTRKY